LENCGKVAELFDVFVEKRKRNTLAGYLTFAAEMQRPMVSDGSNSKAASKGAGAVLVQTIHRVNHGE